MKKSKLNFTINVVTLTLMTALMGIGFLMKYRLLSGRERWEKYGENIDLTLFGLDRHDWGTIHLILGFVLLGFLALHILLHWKTIVSVFNSVIHGKQARYIISAVFCAIILLFAIVPFVINIEFNGSQRNEGRRYSVPGDNDAGFSLDEHEPLRNNQGAGRGLRSGSSSDNNQRKADNYRRSAVEIKGYMTIDEVSIKCNIPTEYLKKHLGVPLSTSDKQRLGTLRKKYNFKINDVVDIVDVYHKEVGNDSGR